MIDQVKVIRLANVAKELNIGSGTIVEFLNKEGFDVENKPTTKLTSAMHDLLLTAFRDEKTVKEESLLIGLGKVKKEDIGLEDIISKKSGKTEKGQEEILIKNLSASEIFPEPENENETETNSTQEQKPDNTNKEINVKVVGKINLDALVKPHKPSKKNKEEQLSEIKAFVKIEKKESDKPTVIEPPPVEEQVPDITKNEVIRVKTEKLQGLNIVNKIVLPEEKKKQLVASSDISPSELSHKRKKRKRKKSPVPISYTPTAPSPIVGHYVYKKPHWGGKKKFRKGKDKETTVLSEKEIQDQIKSTLAILEAPTKSKAAKYRRLKREETAAKQKEVEDLAVSKKMIQVTEFVTAQELAQLMNTTVNDIISACMNLGIFVSINQRLDAETLTVVADEFDYEVEFVSAEVQEQIIEVPDNIENLLPKPPVVTIMGHVDHGKTSLLDYIRNTNVIAGEAGGITQHIGAYEVELSNNKKITFIDTPGHEAFTAMRARGAQITDIAIIVIAADDNVMPQTKEAINHAQAAGVPMIFALNKIDKEGANPDRVKEQLSKENILVEDWGGKHQCQEISAKKGVKIDLLLEKVLLEAEMLELKANPNKLATGTVIEATMEKGKGIVTTTLIQGGTLKVGDAMVAGCNFGKVKAMFNERGIKLEAAGPATPVQILGFNTAPQAGDKLNVMSTEAETKQIATKRLHLQREQGIRTKKHITLDEIGRRLAIGNFKELNVIVKGDVDGSVEAISDSLLKLSVAQVKLNVIHKSVGQIIDSDVLLASASDAIIVGFQVRPSLSARKLAEKEQIDIRLYSIIYNAVEEIKAAIEGMLDPVMEEKIVCNVEAREVFKITKVGTIAGCYVQSGKISRNTKIRIIRDGIVIHTGVLSSLKRFKDDVKEVSAGFECGLSVANFNDFKESDIVEGYEEVEVKK